MFLFKGNICGERIRIARAIHKPYLTQDQLAKKIQFMGFTNMTRMIISRIEKGERHVIDAELQIIAQALGVSVEWLIGSVEE